MTNLCVTCSHFELHPDNDKDPEYGLCKLVPVPVSLITGLPKKPIQNFASVERGNHKGCGSEGINHSDKSLSQYTTEVPNV